MSESKKEYRIRARRFMLTYNSVHADKQELCEKIRREVKKEVTYVAIAHEVGKKCGRPHTHVIVECKERLDQSSKCLAWADIHPRVDAARSQKHWDNMVKYMEKEDENVYTWGSVEVKEKTGLIGADLLSYPTMAEAMRDNDPRLAMSIKVLWDYAQYDRPREVKELKEHPWQEKLAELLDNMDDRSIFWVYDKVGGTGKSTWAQRQHLLRKALYVGYVGKVNDFIEVIYHAKDGWWDHEYLFVDLTRQQEKGSSIYLCIEEARKEVLTRGKYGSRTFELKRQPKVCVFANWPPDVSKLSLDRWRIWEIDAAALTLEYRPPHMFKRMRQWEEDGWTTS